MGWNSWDSYGLTITESEFMTNADWLAQHLKNFGWQYAVVDEGWFLQNPEAKPARFQYAMDQNGRFIPAANRFPSAASGVGFKPLADHLHSLGLRFGIHIVRGIPREAVAKNVPIAGSHFSAADAADQSDVCPWNQDMYGIRASPAGQAHYDSIARLYASWGVDFLKVDCIASHPYKHNEIRMISEALRKTGRPIVLSLSPGPAPLEKAAELARWAQMWRISNDVWDHWGVWPKREWSQGVLGQFAVAAQWAPAVAPGHWPDADMLPLGYIGPRPGEGDARQSALTHEEQRTLLTLWCMLRSPLMMGGNLTQIDAWTAALLTSQEVLAVDQHATGARAAVQETTKVIWTARSAAGNAMYAAVFNLADNPQTVEYPLQPLGLSAVTYAVRDLWEHRDLGTADRLKVTLQPHASVLYELKPR